MVALPAFTAFTTPVLLTVATLFLLLFQLTVLLVAFEGLTVAFSATLCPTANVTFLGFILTLLTGVGGLMVTVQLLLTPATVQVMTVVPTPFAFTLPLLTLATAVLLEVPLGLFAAGGVPRAVGLHRQRGRFAHHKAQLALAQLETLQRDGGVQLEVIVQILHIGISGVQLEIVGAFFQLYRRRGSGLLLGAKRSALQVFVNPTAGGLVNGGSPVSAGAFVVIKFDF